MRVDGGREDPLIHPLTVDWATPTDAAKATCDDPSTARAISFGSDMGLLLSKPIAANSSDRAIIPDSVSHQPRLFGRLLAEGLARQGFSQRAFADAVQAANPHVNLILQGKRTPPLDRIKVWGDVLKFGREEREAFKLAALLAHAPIEIEELFLGLQAKTAQDAKKLVEITAHLRTLRIKLPESLGDA